MPLFLQEQLKPEGELGLWRIEEPEAWFLRRLDLAPEESEQFSRIKGRRRVEWLAVRQLVHTMSGRESRGAFLKDEHGKPHLEGSPFEISISHSWNMAAAIAAPYSVGIDIQVLVPRIERLAHRYMRPEEIASLQGGNRIEQLHIYWGAKEALYKAYGRRALDFSTHIHVHPFIYRPEGGLFTGEVQKEEFHRFYELHYQMEGNYMLVYGLEQTRANAV